MSIIKKQLLSVCALLLLTCLASGCNTVRGAGQDVSAGGHAISRAAS